MKQSADASPGFAIADLRAEELLVRLVGEVDLSM